MSGTSETEQESKKSDEVRWTSTMEWVKSPVKRQKKVLNPSVYAGCGPTDDSSSEDPRSDIDSDADSDSTTEWNVVEGIRRIY